jgi:diaminopimelate epimerase
VVEIVITSNLNSEDSPHSTMQLSVDMGIIEDVAPPTNWGDLGCHEDRPVRHVSLGNPHSVVGVDDVNAVDLVALGRQVPQVNLEIVEPGPEFNAVTMRVHERGAGLTLACGTGACAVADAAMTWGLVPASCDAVVVHMPGGAAAVAIDRASRRATLTGPATFVATILVELSVPA